jgi:hypothetical protein
VSFDPAFDFERARSLMVPAMTTAGNLDLIERKIDYYHERLSQR